MLEALVKASLPLNVIFVAGKNEELQEEKEITRQQRIVIAEQDSMIQAQLERLKALGAEIMAKEKELEDKIKTILLREKELT